MVVEWPRKHRLSWHLGVKDGQPITRRVSTHDRLGGRRRDRSPSDGGDGGRRQYPPATWHDIARLSGRGDTATSNRDGGRGPPQGGGYRRRDVGVEVTEALKDAGAGEKTGSKIAEAPAHGDTVGKQPTSQNKMVFQNDLGVTDLLCLTGERTDSEEG